jgi:transcriptional regulator with XRE-family HTH domain
MMQMEGKFTGIMTSFSARTRLIMEANSLTITGLAHVMGVSERTAINYMNGTNFPKFEGMVAVAEAYNVDLNWWMRGKIPDGKQVSEPSEFKNEMRRHVDELITLLTKAGDAAIKCRTELD